MGLLAALAVPALKNLGKSNVQVSASRQLLDDFGRARQLAISQHATVYMVFVPTNFFSLPRELATPEFSRRFERAHARHSNQMAALTAMTNLLAKQLSGYNFISLGRWATSRASIVALSRRLEIAAGGHLHRGGEIPAGKQFFTDC